MRTTQPNLPYYGLDVVAKFPLMTREDYAAKYGAPAVFDYFKPIKRWRDPLADPASATRPEFIPYLYAVDRNGGFNADKDGFVEPVPSGMSADEAWAVNIPPNLGTVPGSTPTSEVRMPIELLGNERLQKQPGLGGLRVRRVDVPDAGAPAPAGGFTESDRAALYTVFNWVKAQQAGK